MELRRYDTTAADGGRGRVWIPVPFDPNTEWAVKDRHHVAGTVNGLGVRGVIEMNENGWGIMLGPAWRRGCGVALGERILVEIAPEGPQRGDLADDVAAALRAHPKAAAFFDSLAQFYRRAYLQWIDATKRRPELRAERIAEVVRLLEAGIKQRPDR